MKKKPASKTRVSAFMREMWAAESEHPVFAGSLHNFKLILGAESSKPGAP